jgi:hypothetical protein
LTKTLNSSLHTEKIRTVYPLLNFRGKFTCRKICTFLQMITNSRSYYNLKLILPIPNCYSVICRLIIPVTLLQVDTQLVTVTGNFKEITWSHCVKIESKIFLKFVYVIDSRRLHKNASTSNLNIPLFWYNRTNCEL